MGCEVSGVVCCDLFDTAFCFTTCLWDECCGDKCCSCCNWNRRTFFKFLPRFLIGAALDLFAMMVMMYTTCVYYYGENYFERAQNYSFSLNPSDLWNYCDLTNNQTAARNLTEVTHHKTFFSLATIWIVVALLYTIGWLFLYIHVAYVACKAYTCGGWQEFRFSKYYINAKIYKSALGVIKFLNFTATVIIIVKGSLLVSYVVPSDLEIFIFAVSAIDCIFCITDVIGLVRLVIIAKTTADLEEEENGSCDCIVSLFAKLGCKYCKDLKERRKVRKKARREADDAVSDQANGRLSSENEPQSTFETQHREQVGQQIPHARARGNVQDGSGDAWKQGHIHPIQECIQEEQRGQLIKPITFQPIEHFMHTKEQSGQRDPKVPVHPVGQFGSTGQTEPYGHNYPPTQEVAVAMPQTGPNAQNAPMSFFTVAEHNQTPFQGINQNIGHQRYVAPNLPYNPHMQNIGHTQYHPMSFTGQNQYPPPAQYYGWNGQWYS